MRSPPMSDSAALVLVVAALFAMESLAILPEPAVVFVSGWWRRCAARPTIDLLRVARGRLLVLNPARASAHHYLCGIPALVFDAEGIADAAPEDFDMPVRRAFVRWEAVGAVSHDGRTVRATGLGRIDAGTERNARLWARVLEAARRADPVRRQRIARDWQRVRFSCEHAARRVGRVAAACRDLEAAGDLAWPIVAGLAVALLLRDDVRLLYALLAAGELSGWALAVLYFRAHVRLHPRDRRERWGKAAVMALCFPVALRARASLGSGAVAYAHPAAVAAVLLRKGDAFEFLRDLAARWSFPVRFPSEPARGFAAAAPVRATVLEQIEALAKTLGAGRRELAPTRPGRDGSAVSFCPRCGATYLRDSGECADCPGVALRRLN